MATADSQTNETDADADADASWGGSWLNPSLARLGEEFDKWSGEFQSRGETLRTRGETLRAEGQKRVEEHLDQLRTELRKVPAVRQAEDLRQALGERVEKNLDASVDRVYERLQLVRLDEVKKLERKVARLSKKLRALEKQEKV
jgi:chaperonin cofactor prefoldin